MVAVAVRAFRGQVPRVGTRLLGENFAQRALNCRISNGEMVPLRGPGLVHTSLATAFQTMYRYRFGSATNWMVWDAAVDVARSPTAQDALGRLFYTGDGEPRMTTYADAISGPGPYPAAWYVLGVTPPSTAPSLAVTGGSAPTEARAYLYTFVTQYGEESPPSPPVVVTGNITGSWDLTNLEVAPPNSGTISAAVPNSPVAGQVTVTFNTVRGLQALENLTFAAVVGMTDLNGARQIISITGNTVVVACVTAQTYTSGGTWARRAPHNTANMKKRIYRTISGSTDYKFVAEIAVATTSYSDTTAATALGNAIPTLGSSTPPKDMHSLTPLANGALAGLSGNQLCLSEPFKPYSWPQANRYAFAGQGVALCAASNSVIVLTDGKPIIATATVPEAASLAGVEVSAPCIAKLGVVDIGGGCIFPSNDGLYRISPGGVQNVTEGLFRAEEWAQLKPETFRAAYFDQQYFANFDTDTGGRVLIIDIEQPDSVVEVDLTLDSIFASDFDGALYVSIGNKVYEWDTDDENRMLTGWRSREYQFSAPINFVFAQVHADYGEVVPIDDSILLANQAILANADNVNGEIASAEILAYSIAGSALRQVPNVGNRIVQFSLLKNGVVNFTKQVLSNRPFKLPAGFKSEIQAFEVDANVSVKSVAMAQSIEELKRIGL